MKLHLGAGARVLHGWTNLDFEPVAGVQFFDARKPLPFGDGSVEAIYSEHFIEHLTLAEGETLFRELGRVLGKGGVIRFSTPDLKTLVQAYDRGDLEYYKPVGWVPDSAARMLNEGLTSWGHKFTYDWAELSRVFRSVGLDPKQRAPGASQFSVFREVGPEGRPALGDLVVEAQKDLA